MNSIMWDYIKQEPEVLSRMVGSDQYDELVKKWDKTTEAVYFVAHGSSFNAAITVASLFHTLSGLRAYAFVPGNLFANGGALFLEPKNKVIVIGISQTGTSAGVISSLRLAKEAGYRTIAITADEDSPISQLAGHTLKLLCGVEDSNAKTKGYSATLMALILLALSFGRRTNHVSEKFQQELLQELNEAITQIPEILKKALSFCESVQFGTSMKDLYVIGSTMHLGTAQEGQLKIMETMCIPTMFNDIGEFSHGMHRSIGTDSSMLFLRVDDEKKYQVLQAFEYFSKICPNTWMIDATQERIDNQRCLQIPKQEKTKSLFLMVLVIQIFSVYAPELLGKDPNTESHTGFTVVDGTRV